MEIPLDSEQIRIIISAGVTNLTKKEKDEEALIRKANDVLYRAKGKKSSGKIIKKVLFVIRARTKKLTV